MGRGSFLGTDADQMVQRANKDLSMGNGRRGVAFVVELVAGYQLEAITGPEDERGAVVVREVQQASR